MLWDQILNGFTELLNSPKLGDFRFESSEIVGLGIVTFQHFHSAFCL